MQFHDTDIGSHLSDSILQSPNHPHRITLDPVPGTRIPAIIPGLFRVPRRG